MLPKKCPVCKQKSLTYLGDYVSCESCGVFNKRLNFLQKQLVWTKNKIWWWRVPILGYFIFIFVRYIQKPDVGAGMYMFAITAFDVGIHELGHVIFSGLGDFMHVLGGSLFQCLFPLMGVLGSYQKKWYFGATMFYFWFAINLHEVANYVADARAGNGLLLGGLSSIGSDLSDQELNKAHDWYNLLSRTHHLKSDLLYGHILRGIAGTVMVLSLLWGINLTIMIFKVNRTKQTSEN